MAEHILIIDDDPDALALIRLMLRRRGYGVSAASSGAEALDMLASGDLPDLILLDLMMPFMDGYEVCSRLRANPRTASVPIVMLTAKSQMSSQIEGLRLGADDYVVKPVYPDELAARIRAALDRAAVARARGSVIGCLGCKGGVGTTTVAVNVALVLATRGQAVLTDLSGDALVYLGRPLPDGATALSKLEAERIDRRAIEQAWIAHSDSLSLLYDDELLANRARAEVILDHLASMVDFSVLDLGAGTFTGLLGLRWIAESCDALALVLMPGRLEVERARRILKRLNDWQVATPVYPVWIVRADEPAPAELSALNAGLGHPVAHVIPYATEPLIEAHLNTPAAEPWRGLADSLVRR